MARSRVTGVVGLRSAPVEVSPGVYESPITEHDFSGNLIGSKMRYTVGENVQNGITANHRISIIPPGNLLYSFEDVVYVSWQLKKWSVIGIEYPRPRVILTLGGIYDE